MSAVTLIISYDNRKVTNDSYCVRAMVDPLTVPASIQNCLVVRRGSATINERLSRIATFDEIYTENPPSTPLPTLPSTVNNFSSISFGTIPISTSILITSPDWWIQYFGVSATFSVTTIDGAGTVSFPFPAFANSLQFQIDGVTYTDGLANRIYPDVNTFYLASDHCSEWDNYDDASNMYTILSAGAQPLVNSYHDDQFSLQTQKVYQ